MGNTCKPMAVSFQCMTKSTTIKIIIIKQTKKRKSVDLLSSHSMPGTLLSSGFAFYPSYHLSLLKRFILIPTAILITDRPFCPRHGAGSLDFH